MAKRACNALKVDGGWPFQEKTGLGPLNLSLPPCAPIIALLVQAEPLVWIVNVVVAALLLDTVALDIEKQPFEREGLLETVHEIVPV